MLIRPFRLRLSILDLRTSQSNNTNETSTRMNNLTLKLNDFLYSMKKLNDLVTISDRDEHDREIIQRFLQSNNENDARKLLTQMWKESRFCDLMLVLDGSEYLAHRIILAAFSPKYRAFFRERRSDFVTRTHLRHSSHKGLQLVLNFLYTGELTLTYRNVNDVLKCAKELDIGKIFEISEEFFLNFEKRHIFRIFEFSRHYNLKKSFSQSHQYLSKNFTQCIQMKTFLQLPYSTISHLLSDENIHQRDENIVLSRILNWISANHIDNQQIIGQLLKKIRWNKLDYEQQREWLTASQELTDNSKLNTFIKEQITFAHEKNRSRYR